MQGRNPDGSAYAGEVQMTQSANVISMAWRVLTIDWGETTPVVYGLMPDGSLHGTWADGMALEKLSRQ